MRKRNAGWSLSVLLLVLLCTATLPAQTTRPLGEGDPTTSGFTPYNGIATIRGWRFVVNAPGVTVTELGCRYPDSNTTAKTITLWAMAPTPTALGSATITPGPGWRWAQLTTPIPLTQAAEYTVSAYSSAQMYENNSVPTPSPWKPTGVIQYINLQWQNNPSAVTNFPSGNFGGNSQQGVVDIGYVTGPQLTVAATAGTAQNTYNNEQGPGGNGLQVGTFTIASNSQPGAVLNNIKITALGSGNDQTAFSQVSIYRDANSTTAFEAGADAPVALSVPSFPANDGEINFSVLGTEQNFGTTETRRYFIVIRLAGAAAGGDVFNFTVSDITVSGPNITKSGVPSAVMNGMVIQAPAFVFTDVSPAAPVTAYLDSANNVCQAFTVGYPVGPDNKPQSISITALGTGHEANHVLWVELWHDSNASGDFESASDTAVHGGAFNGDNGTITFGMAGQADFQAGQTRRYFVVYSFNQGPLHNNTFQCFVSAAAGAQYGATYNGLPCPGTGGSPGLVISAVALTATMNGPASPVAVQSGSDGPGGEGHLLCDITLTAREGAPWNLGSLVFAAAGTAAHDTAYTQLALHEDSGNGVWDGAANDPIAAPALTTFSAGPAYDAAFVLANDLLAASGTRRFFLVGKLSSMPTSGQTLNARLEAATGAVPTGGFQVDIPTLDSSALVIGPAALNVTNLPGLPPALRKAGSAHAVLLGAFRLTSINDATDVDTITFTMTGSGNWAASMDAVNGVQVYWDNGDHVFTEGTETLMHQGPGAASVSAFMGLLTVPAGSTQDIWVRVNVDPGAAAGAVAPQTFSLTIVQASDVVASNPVAIGSPAPQGAILTLVNLTVTAFDPPSAATAGGAPITITGTGFLAPFTVTIGGLACPGTPVVTAVQVTGLTVPPGSGSNLPIVIVSGGLAPETISHTFSYGNTSASGGGAGSGGGGCVAGPVASALGVLPLLAMMTRARRRPA